MIGSKTTKKRWRHRFPHYKSMGAFCCHGNQSFDPIFPKILCSLSPTPVMLHIKFDQYWPTGFKDIHVWKCGRRTPTDDGPLVYYKLTLWAFGSGELTMLSIRCFSNNVEHQMFFKQCWAADVFQTMLSIRCFKTMLSSRCFSNNVEYQMFFKQCWVSDGFQTMLSITFFKQCWVSDVFQTMLSIRCFSNNVEYQMFLKQCWAADVF